MAHHLLSIVDSEKKRRVVGILLQFPKRPWSCSSVEELTGLPHATAFRIVKDLSDYGILKSVKVNRKDILYELVRESPFTKQLEGLLLAEQKAIREMAGFLKKKIVSGNVNCILLFGSSVKGTYKPRSDIDILVVVRQKSAGEIRRIQDKAAEVSVLFNKTLSVQVIGADDLRMAQKDPFLSSVKEHHEVIYGKEPF